MKRLFCAVCAGVMALSMVGCGGGGNNSSSSENRNDITRVADTRNLTPEEYTIMNTVGTDALGRTIKEADKVKDGTRYVGIWYSLWEGQHNYQQTDIYDNTVLLSTQAGSVMLNDPSYNGKETRLDEFHFCGQPLYGYYNMLDPWVVRRHVELLTEAGMDYICFDTTNAAVYIDVARLVLKTLQEFQNQGFKVPKAMFYTNSYSGTTAKKIYDAFYQNEEFDDVWFSPNGKPMLCGITEDSRGASDQTMLGILYPNDPKYEFTDYVPEEIKYRFDLRESQWPQGLIEHENGLPWMSWHYPQHIAPNLKAISVSVAQHGDGVNFSNMSPPSSRGYDYKTGIVHKDWEKGQNFANEWQSVFDYEAKGTEINNVLLCGWNEWMALKTWDGNKVNFCDVFTEEYSRDIEMMNGKGGDNFYMQMIQNIRKWKFTEAKHYNYQRMTMDITDESMLDMWDSVNAHYRDFSGEVTERNFKSASENYIMYTDKSNRNDITDVKVVHNGQNLYFYVQTKEPITDYNGTDENWMTILINAKSGGKGFEGYNYIINRHPNSDGTTSIEKSNSGYNWNNAGTAQYKVYGNVILYSIPLNALGLNASDCYVQFKVTDNITKPDDIMDYYISGESAPIGRLSYSYGY